jgi:hypothetical protein
MKYIVKEYTDDYSPNYYGKLLNTHYVEASSPQVIREWASEIGYTTILGTPNTILGKDGWLEVMELGNVEFKNLG